MPNGWLAIVLHAHLPYIRHPEYKVFIEERWLYEAITETYIPLFQICKSLLEEGVKFDITIDFSPTLISMFMDPLLKQRYSSYLLTLEELIEREEKRLNRDPDFYPVILFYKNKIKNIHKTWDELEGDLVKGFRYLQENGCIEIMTCAATHGYLPLLEPKPQMIQAQISLAVQNYIDHFNSVPRGIWLPECAYYIGLEEILAQNGLYYFIADTHAVLNATPRPQRGIFAPIFCPGGVATFGRDPESSKQVWSSEEGYPGDFIYRDFYRDIGFDLSLDQLGSAAHPMGIRLATGLKYYRITGKTDYKEPYNPYKANEKAAQHAGNFLFNRQKQIEWQRKFLDRPPLIVSPYDAELFGHWWFEGPDFLYYLFKKIHYDQSEIKTINLANYLEMYPENQVAQPEPSSWGAGGYYEVWLEGSNSWIWRHIHWAGEKMIELSHNFWWADGIQKRALNQAARELLLLQSSDWPFIIKTGTAVKFAQDAFKSHLARFTTLVKEIENGRIDEQWLDGLEQRDNIFPFIDFHVFS